MRNTHTYCSLKEENKNLQHVNTDHSTTRHTTLTLFFLLVGLGTHRGTFTGDGLEARFNTSDRTARTARFTLQEEQSRVLLQDRIGRAAGVAGDVFLDVSSQHVFDLFRLEAALDDELIVTVDRPARTQLSQQEVEQMLL